MKLALAIVCTIGLVVAAPADSSNRIQGGHYVDRIEDAPYHVAVLKEGKYSCGGALIGPDVVITSAHCVQGFELDPESLKIRYGTIKLNDKKNDIVVKKVTVHPKFDSETLNYDVAILRMVKSFSSKTGAQAVHLNNKEPEDGDALYLTGWGLNGPAGEQEENLKGAYLSAQSRDECFGQWAGEQIISKQMLCAFSNYAGSCHGDGGSPLTYNGKLVGVLSFASNTCRDDDKASVYTDFTHSSIANWIYSNSM